LKTHFHSPGFTANEHTLTLNNGSQPQGVDVVTELLALCSQH